MKANKIFAAALAALTLVGFSACKKDNVEALSIDPTSMTLKVGEEGTITANLAATWTSSDEAVATVAPGNDGGKTAKVTALKEGNSIITASVNGETKTCVVVVSKGGGDDPQGASIEATNIWPIILDGTTAEANAAKIVASFAPNDVDQHLWLWEGTYDGGTATGKNFFGNTDGYCALVVTSVGWSGAGFCLDAGSEGLAASETLRKAIIANPDDYFLHIAIKSTDQASHTFYVLDNDQTKFVLGSQVFDGGFVFGNFERDGAWYEFDIPMSRFSTALASKEAGANVFVMLSGGVSGTQLNLDAVYFYKK